MANATAHSKLITAAAQTQWRRKESMTEISRQSATSERVKVRFPLPPEDQARGVEAENLWAQPLGGALYRIDNSPFYAYGISYEDVVTADEVDGRLNFREVVARSGRSTFRVLVKDAAEFESPGFRALWNRLSLLGCTYEVAKRRWVSIDVPSNSDVFAIYDILEEGMTQGVWTFEEAHCGHR